MKRFFSLFCTLTFFVAGTSWANPLKTVIQKYQRDKIQIGVLVQEAKTGKELFSHNKTDLFNPASTMKVVTSSAVLSHLGSNYRYKTKFAADHFSKGVAKNLYIKGSGDPSLVEERLWRIGKDLYVRGVRKIEGDLIIDNSFFDGFKFAGQERSNARAYNASTSAFAVNFNSFAVVAVSHGGGDVSVHVDPPTDYFELKSHVGSRGNSLVISRDYKKGREYVTVKGGVSTEKIKYANVDRPLDYAGATLRWVFDQVGIEFKGAVREGRFAGKKHLFTDKSKAVSLIISDLNKFSNNFTAEMLVKTLGAESMGTPGSTDKGVAVLRQHLKKIGISDKHYQVFNGSGLSRKNRLSPQALNRVLLSLYKNNRVRSDFISSLSVAGVDGTLKSRLGYRLTGNVKAKTGTLHDVSAVSGYLETHSGTVLAFSVLVNGPGAGSGSFNKFHQQLLEAALKL